MTDGDRPVVPLDTTRIGLCGEKINKHDNGTYLAGKIGNHTILFLIDSGSNSTLLSYEEYCQLDSQHRPVLMPTDVTLMAVNKEEIKVYGVATFNLEIGNYNFLQRITVCEMGTDAILGQDFLLKNDCKLDFKRSQITIKDYTVPIHVGGEAENISPVFTTETISIPPLTSMFVEVQLPKQSKLNSIVMVETAPNPYKGVIVVPGIIDTTQEKTIIHVMNPRDEEVNIYPNTKFGVCQSLYLREPRDEMVCYTSNSADHIIDPSTAELVPDHLKDMFERGTQQLDESQKGKLAQLLTTYQSVFSKSPDDIGRTNRVLHKINTGTAIPIRQPLRRLPLGKKSIEKEEIEKMLDMGVIEASRSPWSSSVVLVTKKDNTTRFCVDYRNLNDVTVKDAYPLPRIDECLDSLEGKKWFSSLDLNSGFWQIGMAEEDKEKTAFSTSQGLYQFRVMPFGLTNSPSTFQRLMEDVLRGLQWEECLIYMDDIIVPAATVEQSLERLEHILKRFREANLKLKPKKCNLFQTSIKFLGHVVSEEGVQTDPEKIEAVKDWRVPRSAKEVKSFLGLASYYRRFIKGFAAIARPLHQISNKGSKFLWSDECQKAFDELKAALTSSPILAFPKPGVPFKLDTDASNFAIGAALSQDDENGAEHVIAYMSSTLNKHEVAYCVTRKELLAVVKALRCFHSYVYGQHVLLRTDNAAVSWMRSLKNPSGQVARWLQELGTYDLECTHRPGHQHRNADALSRNPCRACRNQEVRNADDGEKDEDVSTPKEICRAVKTVNMSSSEYSLPDIHPEDIQKDQLEDPDIEPIMTAIVNEAQRPPKEAVSADSKSLKTLWRQWDRLVVKHGILYRQNDQTDSNEVVHQLVTPRKYRETILYACHDIPSAAHLGMDKTLSRLKQAFYWPGMKNDTRRYIEECDKCTARKMSKQGKAPMKRYLVGEPFERVQIDIFGPLPKSDSGNRYILTMCDCFTKWTEAVAIPDQEGSTVTKAFVDTFISRFGAPLQLHSDRGRNFESEIFREMCKLFGIDKTRTTSMRPQSNGNIERYHMNLGLHVDYVLRK